MTKQHLLKWRHIQADIILLCVRWYLRYALSYRDLAEIMLEQGLSVHHTTIYRWVQAYAPELEKRCRPHLKACNDSWKVDETYIKIKKIWVYLYRAVDSQGNTLEFLLSPTHDAEAAKRFSAKHCTLLLVQLLKHFRMRSTWLNLRLWLIPTEVSELRTRSDDERNISPPKAPKRRQHVLMCLILRPFLDVVSPLCVNVPGCVLCSDTSHAYQF